MNLLSVPHQLWDLYVQNLWYYRPGTWVYSAASTFQFLAFVVIAPFVLLTLLDVTSYVIARTLGVIDDTKASTSETGTATGSGTGTPSIVIKDHSAPSIHSRPTTTPPSSFFRNTLVEEGNLELSGVGMFSPAPSQPPSPTMSRRELNLHTHNIPEDQSHPGEGTNNTEPYLSREPSSGELSSGGSSYAMLEHESGSEDVQLTLRRRARAEPEVQPHDEE